MAKDFDTLQPAPEASPSIQSQSDNTDTVEDVKSLPKRRKRLRITQLSRSIPPETKTQETNITDDDFFNLTSNFEDEEEEIGKDLIDATQEKTESVEIEDKHESVETSIKSAEELDIKEPKELDLSEVGDERLSKRIKLGSETTLESEKTEVETVENLEFVSTETTADTGTQEVLYLSSDIEEEIQVNNQPSSPVAVVEVIEDEFSNLDPEIAARVRARKAESQRLKEDVFPVGYVIQTKIPILLQLLPASIPPIVITESSSTRLGVVKSKYLSQLYKYLENSPDALVYFGEVSNDIVFAYENTLVFDFSTALTLNIQADINEQGEKGCSLLFDAYIRIEYDQQRQREFDEKLLEVDNDEKQEEIDQLLQEQMETARRKQEQENQEISIEEGYFRVNMKGKDNIPVTVQVNSQTSIQKLIDYYRAKHNILANQNIQLVFDDEDLDPLDLVGSTELEEDFTIDVHIS